MQIEKFSGGPYDTIGYVVSDKGEAIAIDVPLHTAKKIDEYLKANKLKLKMIVATHVHWDHIADAYHLYKLTGARFVLHKLDEENQHEINSIFEGEAGVVRSDQNIEEDTQIEVGSVTFIVLHTPGHTPGSVCLHSEKQKMLFSGDTLFAGTHGRVDFPLSDAEEIGSSLRRLSGMDADTKVYPGHGQPTTIGREKWLMKF